MVTPATLPHALSPAALLQVEDPVEHVEVTPELVAAVLTVVVAAYVVALATDWLLTAAADRLLVHRFRVTLLIPMVKVAIYALAAYLIVVTAIEPTREQLLAFAGLFGAAVGFGFQDLAADVLGGLAILVERPYRIGDKVSIGDHYGEVVDIGLRSTRLETLDDDLVTVPNHQFFEESIVNGNAGRAEMLVTVTFYADPAADPGTASRIVEEALATSQYVYVTDRLPISVRLDDGPFYYTITGKAYVNDLRNEGAFRSDVTERVLAAFREHGVQSPRPGTAGAGSSLAASGAAANAGTAVEASGSAAEESGSAVPESGSPVAEE